MFLQNFARLSAAIHKLSWSQRKKPDDNNTVVATAIASHFSANFDSSQSNEMRQPINHDEMSLF